MEEGREGGGLLRPVWRGPGDGSEVTPTTALVRRRVVTFWLLRAALGGKPVGGTSLLPSISSPLITVFKPVCEDFGGVPLRPLAVGTLSLLWLLMLLCLVLPLLPVDARRCQQEVVVAPPGVGE